MPNTLVGIIEIVGPAILLVVLIWLVVRGRSDAGSSETVETTETTEKGTRDLYREEDIRRHEGTDDL